MLVYSFNFHSRTDGKKALSHLHIIMIDRDTNCISLFKPSNGLGDRGILSGYLLEYIHHGDISLLDFLISIFTELFIVLVAQHAEMRQCSGVITSIRWRVPSYWASTVFVASKSAFSGNGAAHALRPAKNRVTNSVFMPC